MVAHRRRRGSFNDDFDEYDGSLYDVGRPYPYLDPFGPPSDAEPEAEDAESKPEEILKPQGFADVTEIADTTSHRRGEDIRTILTSEYRPQPRKKKTVKPDEFDKYAVVLRRFVSVSYARHSNNGYEMCIQSETLCDTFREIVKYTHDSLDIQSTPIIIPGPLYILFFYRKEIEAYVLDETKPQHLRDEVKLLDDFIKDDTSIVRNVKEYDALKAQGRVTAENIWTLFPPNELLIRNDGECPEAWICRDFSQDRSGNYWNIVGVRLGFNGKQIGVTDMSFPVPCKFKSGGTMEIAKLPLIPMSYYSKESEVRKLLINRGRAFQNIMGHDLDGYAYKQYHGTFWYDNGLFPSSGPEVNGRFVVDYKGYLDRNHREAAQLIGPDGLPRPGEITVKPPAAYRHPRDQSPDSFYDVNRYDDAPHRRIRPVAGTTPPGMRNRTNTPNKDTFEETLEDASQRFGVIKTMDDLFLLCPARIPGYDLHNKRWGWVLIDDLKEIVFSEKPFDSLQMDIGQKMLLEALVRGHSFEEKGQFDDFIAGKGKGLVMLLHGTPGIGKTLTAESIAEHMKAPLYTVTGGELSVEIYRVEEKLKSIFRLAKRWKAIVLLDEADVIMSKRQTMELERSALVALWLRMLEYFEGVLFLTTNRFGDCDEAFKSRINLTIQLPDLDEQQRANIWKGLVDVNPEAVQTSLWGEEAFKCLGQLDINGRVIKNILKTAACYAKSERAKLSIAHVRTVVKVELSKVENIDKIVNELEKLDLKRS